MVNQCYLSSLKSTCVLASSLPLGGEIGVSIGSTRGLADGGLYIADAAMTAVEVTAVEDTIGTSVVKRPVVCVFG